MKFLNLYLLFFQLIGGVLVNPSGNCRFEDGYYESQVVKEKTINTCIVEIEGCRLVRIIKSSEQELLNIQFKPIEIDDSGLIELKSNSNQYAIKIGNEIQINPLDE